MADEEEDALNARLRATRIDFDWAAIAHEADDVTDRLIAEIRQADPEALRASDRLVPGSFGNGVPTPSPTSVGWSRPACRLMLRVCRPTRTRCGRS